MHHKTGIPVEGQWLRKVITCHLNHPKWDSLVGFRETFSSAVQTRSKNVSRVCPEQHPSQCVSGSTRTMSVPSVNLSFFPWPKSHKCLVPIVWELILDIVPVALPTSSQ